MYGERTYHHASSDDAVWPVKFNQTRVVDHFYHHAAGGVLHNVTKVANMSATVTS